MWWFLKYIDTNWNRRNCVVICVLLYYCCVELKLEKHNQRWRYQEILCAQTTAERDRPTPKYLANQQINERWSVVCCYRHINVYIYSMYMVDLMSVDMMLTKVTVFRFPCNIISSIIGLLRQQQCIRIYILNRCDSTVAAWLKSMVWFLLWRTLYQLSVEFDQLHGAHVIWAIQVLLFFFVVHSMSMFFV